MVEAVAPTALPSQPSFGTQVKGHVELVANAIRDFVDRNKALLFFASAVAFCLAATPAATAALAITRSIASGVCIGTAIHLISKGFGGRGFENHAAVKVSQVVMGAGLLVMWAFNPAAAVAGAVFGSGVQLTGLLARGYRALTG